MYHVQYQGVKKLQAFVEEYSAFQLFSYSLAAIL